MIEETLEEAILRIKSENEHYIDEVAFELGAKWQQEKSYSEEDMEISFKAGRDYGNYECAKGYGVDFPITTPEHKKPQLFTKWFEQFKKK